MKIAVLFCLVVLLLEAGSVTGFAAGAEKTILKRKNREPEAVDSAVYVKSTKEYKITAGTVTLSYPEADVQYCRPPKPEGFDKLDAGGLENVINNYQGLWWNLEAAVRLMPLYIKGSEYDKAVRLFRNTQPLISQSVPLTFRRGYWDALQKTRQNDALQKDLTEVITDGDREASAWAYVMRGDAFMAQGKRSDALAEGYLRTVAMFQDVKSCRQDALEKTIAALEAAGDGRVETFRKMLAEEFSK